MERKEKRYYEAPLTESIELEQEGVICGSKVLIIDALSGTRNGYGNAIEYDWE